MKRALVNEDGSGGSAPPPAKKLTKAQATFVEEELEKAKAEARAEARAEALAEAKAEAKAEALLALDAGRKALEDNFTCGVCLALVFEPVSPHCGHQACFACLHRVVSTSPAGTDPLCPTCRVPIEKQPFKWTVNSGIASALEVNNGPGYREICTTLKFHALLREDKPSLALECIKKGGVDLTRMLRLPGGSIHDPFYFSLGRKYGGNWNDLCMEMIMRGVDTEAGEGALDLCRDLPMAELLISKGATKCSSSALYWLSSLDVRRSKVSDADGFLKSILSRLPKPLKSTDRFLEIVLWNSLKQGFERTVMELLEAGVHFAIGTPTSLQPM